jgi:lipopolysaccharide/colanic/teichoic acid biosynthesis glycosyltransferase
MDLAGLVELAAHDDPRNKSSAQVEMTRRLIQEMSNQHADNESLSRRMYWLTVATVALALVQVVLAVVEATQ